MLLKAKQFKKISIRGCVAYGICCLENALEHYNIRGDGWNFLLRKLWWYTELSADCDPSINNCYPLERWAGLNVKIVPGSLCEYVAYSDFVASKWWFKEDLLSEEEYNLLKETYKDSNEATNEICDHLLQIGINELWGGIKKTSPDTLTNLQYLLNVMYKQKIPVPPKEPFEQYVFHKDGWDYDLHGFGEMFDGTQYSKFVNKTK